VQSLPAMDCYLILPVEMCYNQEETNNFKEGFFVRIVIIAIFLATATFGLFLKFLTYSNRNAPLPENVKDIFDKEAYKKNQAYGMERVRFSIINGIIAGALTLSFLLFNVHHWLYAGILSNISNDILVGILMLVIPLTVGTVISSLAGIYDTFVIESKYGFNKTTPITYIADFIKQLILNLIVMGGLLSLFLFLYNLMGNWVFLLFFFILFILNVFMTLISPLLIRIFYKLTPLEEGELKEKIKNLAEKTGYKFKGIYVVNASKRSTKLNAFAAGFGKTKTIGLFDTLIEKMSHDEILSVLAHEIGHAKKRHILKRLLFGIVNLGILVAAAYFIITVPAVSQAFGFDGVNLAFGIYILFIILNPLNLILRIPSLVTSRKHEYEADAFAKENTSKEAGISSLKTLYRESFGNLTPHPFVVIMEHSHPPLSQRLAALE